MTPYRFTLYVADHTIKAARSAAQVRALLGPCGDLCDLEVVDILERPDLAEAAGVLAAPTLILSTPSGERRVVGDFSDPAMTLGALGLQPPPAAWMERPAKG
jgi:circadian clock protein KaiB